MSVSALSTGTVSPQSALSQLRMAPVSGEAT